MPTLLQAVLRQVELQKACEGELLEDEPVCLPFCTGAHESVSGSMNVSMGLPEIHLHFCQAFIPPSLSICSGVDGHVSRTATGYACGFCCKEFVKGSNCRRHVKETHLSMGHFSCPYCNKNFHRSKVQNHINGCSGNTNYS